MPGTSTEQKNLSPESTNSNSFINLSFVVMMQSSSWTGNYSEFVDVRAFEHSLGRAVLGGRDHRTAELRSSRYVLRKPSARLAEAHRTNQNEHIA